MTSERNERNQMKMKIIRVLFVAPTLLVLGVWLAFGQPKGETVTVKGEVVDLWCYLEGGDHGADHKKCAVACAKAGNPIGLVTEKDEVSIMSSLITSRARAGTVNFDDAKTGAPPPGWTATQTGKGAAKWTIEKDDTAPSKPNVLKQSGEATYPVCLKNDTSLKDGFVEVK